MKNHQMTRVRNGELAKYLDVSPASATEMVQRLAKNGFVDYVPYKGARLTEKGLEHGMMMKRRHRLAEVLLTNYHLKEMSMKPLVG